MCTSRNPSRTTSGKAGSSSRPRRNTTASSRPARRSAPAKACARRWSGCAPATSARSPRRAASATSAATASARLAARSRCRRRSTTISGPARRRWCRRIATRTNGPVHYDWHWIWTYGNGDVGNQGIHQMDVARWFLGEPGLPRHTLSIGGRLGYVDDGETPNTQVVDSRLRDRAADFRSARAAGETRHGSVSRPISAGRKPRRGRGDDGQVSRRRDRQRRRLRGRLRDHPKLFHATAYDRDGKVVKEFKGSDRHMAELHRRRPQPEDRRLYGPIDEGHVSSALCHLGNISHQTRSRGAARGDSRKDQGRRALAEAYGRMVEHLATNGVDLAKTPATLGAPLAIDRDAERFTGETAAARQCRCSRATTASLLSCRSWREPQGYVPYSRSPKSPRPGRMYFFALSSRSSAAVKIGTAG